MSLKSQRIDVRHHPQQSTESEQKLNIYVDEELRLDLEQSKWTHDEATARYTQSFEESPGADYRVRQPGIDVVRDADPGGKNRFVIYAAKKIRDLFRRPPGPAAHGWRDLEGDPSVQVAAYTVNDDGEFAGAAADADKCP